MEFYSKVPKYAILSHTWAKEEVTFQDIQNLDVAKNRAGWSKVEKACAYAHRFKFKWIWIDSCCINKESSAELSEAINSMYQYYSEAEVCYVYLSDVREKENPRDVTSSFRFSRWFTRGWTLQELLAPTYVAFLDESWVEIGTKWSLRNAISAITSIPLAVFEDGDIDRYSVAQRMSWAALRETTRPEDQAYCLMGIFGISMSPIYGEGAVKAFMRLELEIIKISDDRSIFAWVAPDWETEPRGLLARSPFEFRASGDVKISESDFLGNKSSFSFNNNGLHIYLPLLPARSHHSEGNLFLASLHCRTERDGKCLSIYLRKSTNSERYVRWLARELPLDSSLPLPNRKLEQVVVKENQLPRRKKLQKQRFTLPPVARHSTYCIESSWAQQASKECLPEHLFAMGVFPRPQSQAGANIKPESMDMHLVYKIQDAEGFDDYFSVAMQYHDQDPISARTNLKLKVWTNPTTSQVSEDPQFFFRESHTWDDIHADRVLAPLESGGMASLTMHLTGKDTEFEVAYLPQLEGTLSMATQMESPKSGFSVPTEIYHDYLSSPFVLTDVFPPDYFYQKRQGKTAYISMPNGPHSFRILTYKYSLRSSTGSYKAFVAFGFHKTNAWADVIAVIPYKKPPRVEEIWNSYLDGGPRAKIRLECQDFASCNIMHSSKIAVNAGERETLQLGMHFLRIELISPRTQATIEESDDEDEY
ncbi:HET-domain-containing protein [Dendrothele bispora CBS 962.96]|uniref:HET-domain-containing protein n=1 Tax=Dendrothele bispora (strain CBS 962.96) TaxID=1314807 RepID=A0A4S8KUC0_DENBC|nr:HET-domain-containing protein [Dendrothele bispora CBS 962.96]